MINLYLIKNNQKLAVVLGFCSVLQEIFPKGLKFRYDKVFFC